MSNFKKCPNGHYYLEDHCPYCEMEGRIKINNDAVWKRISDNAADLKKETNIILEFDTAPDGIKRYVEIVRKRGELYLRSEIARMIDCEKENLPTAMEVKVNELEDLVDKNLLRKNLFPINTPDGALQGEWYLSENSISSMTPETLLTQILGRGSKLDLLYKGNEYRPPMAMDMAKAANTAAAASGFGNEKFQEAREEIESKKYLAVSLEDNAKKVLCIPDREDLSDIKSVEDFVSEDFSIFLPTVVIREYNLPDVEFEYNAERYANVLVDIANRGRQSVYLKVSRQRVAEVLPTLFKKLGELHKQGLVHCDLKPQNILCLKEGLVPFDGINVKVGEVSAGMTANYCAPEQILTQPVSPATDIYNLGLMVLSVIDGIVYGKTSSYVIPTGGTEVKEVRLLSEPMIYIDYASSNIEKKEGIVHWKSFLEKCLAFAACDRYPDIDSFTKEYNQLLERYPLKGDLEFKPYFGRLSSVNKHGLFEPGWFLSAE